MELFSQFAHRVSRITWRQWGMFVIFFAFFSFQVHQLFSFNPYWGYDGGAHVQILETLLYEHRFPTIAENYLAWHEPLYYLVLAGLGFLNIPFAVSHAFIVLVLDVLVFALYRRMGLSNGYALFGSIVTFALPAFLEVSMFLTNEALNYVFLLVIMHAGITLWREERWSWKTSLCFGLCVGFGVVTKITALIAFGVVVILLVLKMIKTRIWKYIFTILFVCGFAMVCYVPWYVVRSEGLSRASINNYDMLPPRAFAWDERVYFMTRFDADIFSFPFWYSGGTGFWSMLYADTVIDYLGIFENQDIKNALPEKERVMTTHNGNSVSAYRKPLAQAAMWLGFIPVGVMFIGLVSSFFVILREIKSRSRDLSDALPVLGFSSAFLLALMYYAYRYPYYDQGVVKSIFIAPAFVLPLAFGMKRFIVAPIWLRVVVAVGWFGYVGVVLSLFFVYR